MMLVDLFKALSRHASIVILAFSAILLTFCATRNIFYLRFMPCIVVAEISRIIFIWVFFLLNTPEATFLRDFYLLIAGRIKREAHKTRHATGRHRRRVEAQFLGMVHQFHGLWFNYAENYLNNIAADAKKRREVHTNDFLLALQQGKKESEDAVIHVKEEVINAKEEVVRRIFRRNRKNCHGPVVLTARSA